MTDRRAIIREAYESACRREIDALKPGNVHRFADGHGMSIADFLTSTAVSSGPLTDPNLSPGERILKAVKATKAAVGINTNLGILLLCGPVAVAAESPAGDLRTNISAVIEKLTMSDTVAVFEAIATASPGGLGDGDQNDVREPPKVPLIEAMRQAAARDRIAYQFANSYEDIFEIGLPALRISSEGGMWPVIAAYLAFLSAFPDSHIARKFNIELAESIRGEAAEIRTQVQRETSKDERTNVLLAFDRSLKQRNINPGTSADLTVSCLFVHSLTERLA